MHEHHQPATVNGGKTNNEHLLRRHRWLTYIALGILGYFLLIEHRAHVIPILPYLFLLVCPFMHIFMHGKHGQHGHSHSDTEKSS